MSTFASIAVERPRIVERPKLLGNCQSCRAGGTSTQRGVERLAVGKETVLSDLKRGRSHEFIEDTVREMEWWVCFQPLDKSMCRAARGKSVVTSLALVEAARSTRGAAAQSGDEQSGEGVGRLDHEPHEMSRKTRNTKGARRGFASFVVFRGFRDPRVL